MVQYFHKAEKIKAYMSDGADDNLSLKWGRAHGGANRTLFLSKFGLNVSNLITAEQVHGSHVAVVGAKERGMGSENKDWIKKCDGLITSEREVILGVETADCAPILFWEDKKGIIGIAHSGWRGTVKNIAQQMVNKIVQLGGNVKNIQVEIGPHIGKCCFEIKKDVADEFINWPKALSCVGTKKYLDLTAVIKSQLIQCGVNKRRILSSKHCTAHEQNFYSYRRQGVDLDGAMLSVIMMI
ncbi:TPA: peptidoglycan editing factor PgeF [Candidatus Falkowbacteria bacterium]|nr:peptidoglycan editing factor PgeF [Candidatus Falkowbacteria bacterium]